MPPHPILPDSEIFRNFILPKEVYLLQGVVTLFISEPLLSTQKLRLFVVIESYSLTADCHILCRVTIRISHDLIVVRVLHSIEIKEVLHHLRKVLVELEDVVRLQV